MKIDNFILFLKKIKVIISFVLIVLIYILKVVKFIGVGDYKLYIISWILVFVDFVFDLSI